jgi:cysteine desulfurase / selenocysteine lyase
VTWFDPAKVAPDGLRTLLEAQNVGVLAVTACSNASGVLLPVRDYVEAARGLGVVTLVDAAQLVPHRWGEVGALGADYVVFSAHKMLGPFGVGVLAGRAEALERLEPKWLGGGTVEQVTQEGFRLRGLPSRLEAGTPPIAEVVGFGAAVDYLQQLGIEEVSRHEALLAERLLGRLRAISGVRVLEDDWQGARVCLASFHVEGGLVGAEQLARMMFDRHGICVRSGHHCAHPYVTARGAPATVRLAAGPYTTLEEIDRAADALGELLGTLL